MRAFSSPSVHSPNNCCQGTSGFYFPAAATSHISSDGKTKLPGFPVPPPPLLFPPVSPDLSASVFSPSLCLTGRLSPSRHSLCRLSAAFISAGQGHSRNAAITPQMKRGPCLLEGGKDERRISAPSSCGRRNLWQKILIAALRFDLE